MQNLQDQTRNNLFKSYNFTLTLRKRKTSIKKEDSKPPTPKRGNKHNGQKLIKYSKKLSSISIKFNCSKKIYSSTHLREERTWIMIKGSQKGKETNHLGSKHPYNSAISHPPKNSKSLNKKVLIKLKSISLKRKNGQRAKMVSNRRSSQWKQREKAPSQIGFKENKTWKNH